MSYTDSAFVLELRAKLAAGATLPVVVGPFHQPADPTKAPEGLAVTLLQPAAEDDDGKVLGEFQVHFRLPKGSGVTAVMDEAERVRLAVIALRGTRMQTVRVAGAWRLRQSPVLFDSLGRPERFDTYRFISDRSAVAR